MVKNDSTGGRDSGEETVDYVAPTLDHGVVQHFLAMFAVSTQRVVLACLVVVLIGIYEFPFWVSSRSSYYTVYLAWSSLQAAACLVLAGAILVREIALGRSLFWLGCTTVLGIIAVVRLLYGHEIDITPLAVLKFGATLHGTAILVPLGLYVFLRCRKRRITASFLRDVGRARFQLAEIFLFTAVCAGASLQFRRLYHAPDGWLVLPADTGEFAAMMMVHSFVMGLLLAPWSLAVFAPRTWGVLALATTGLVCVLSPIVEPLAVRLLTRGWRTAPQPWMWPESYLTVVLDNVLWYGLLCLPAIVLFAIVRCAGVRYQYDQIFHNSSSE